MMKENKSNGGMISFGRVVLISLTKKKKRLVNLQVLFDLFKM